MRTYLACISYSLFHFLFMFPVIVSFGKVTADQREEAKKKGLSIYQWSDFLLLVFDDTLIEFFMYF
jgi:hypothetical protein